MRQFVVGSTMLLLAAGCSSIFDLGRRSITLPITKVEAPPTAAPGASFNVAFTVAMTNGCIRFERLESTETDAALTVTARGSVPDRQDIACTQDVRSETVVEVVTPPTTDPFSVIARQPDGTETTVQVRIQ